MERRAWSDARRSREGLGGHEAGGAVPCQHWPRKRCVARAHGNQHLVTVRLRLKISANGSGRGRGRGRGRLRALTRTRMATSTGTREPTASRRRRTHSMPGNADRSPPVMRTHASSRGAEPNGACPWPLVLSWPDVAWSSGSMTVVMQAGRRAAARAGRRRASRCARRPTQCAALPQRGGQRRRPCRRRSASRAYSHQHGAVES